MRNALKIMIIKKIKKIPVSGTRHKEVRGRWFEWALGPPGSVTVVGLHAASVVTTTHTTRPSGLGVKLSLCPHSACQRLIKDLCDTCS